MNRLRALGVEQQVALLFLILFGLLILASLVAALRSLKPQDAKQQDQHAQKLRDLRALWAGTVVFWLSWMSGALGATLLFGVISFLALREFITLAHTRRSDHRSLILAFFVVLPLQYVLVASRSFDLFSVFIPVYVFLAIPVLSALAGDPQRFLERNAKIQWGIMVCVFGLSTRRHCCCWSCAATPGAAPSCCSSWWPPRPAHTSCRNWPAASCAAARWRATSSRSLLVPRLGFIGAFGGRLGGRRCWYWITPFKRRPGAGDGLHRRGLRARMGDFVMKRAEEATPACAHWGNHSSGHRRGRVCSTASRRCVLPRRCSSIRCAGISSSEAHERPHPRHRPRAADHRLRRGRGRRAATWPTWPAARSAPPRPSLSDLPARLKIIFDGVREVVDTYAPVCASVEIVFVNVNPQSTLLLGQARGAALASLVSGGLPVAEYTALQLKKAIVGHGHAQASTQVQEMVTRLLSSCAPLPGTDAADALGLAITHAPCRRGAGGDGQGSAAVAAIACAVRQGACLLGRGPARAQPPGAGCAGT
jgi:phosphatidate cytidylyltransferase